MKIIFLDIDGVLNTIANRSTASIPRKPKLIYTSHRFGGRVYKHELQPDLIGRVARVVGETGANIVLSSSWRLFFFHSELDVLFNKINPEFKQGTIIDSTPDWDTINPVDITSFEKNGLEENRKIRGSEIDHWLWSIEHPIEKYAIVDDYDDFLGKQKNVFVKTNSNVGLSEDDEARLIQILT